MSKLFTIADSSESITSLHPGIRTWIFDPPYNIGYDYGGVITDRSESYESEIGAMAANMRRNSTYHANMFLVIYPTIASRLLPAIEGVGWSLKQWITWVYPSNIGMSNRRCTTASRAVLWFTSGEPETYMKADQQPYKNPNDKRIKERIANGSKGVNFYDWWEINLRKNVSKGFKGYFNQLPTELVKRMILLTTQEGEWVGDLTAGAGTTWEVAKEIGRSCWLNDLNPECQEIWEAI
tara:strand:+ start:190 stop:900 length:711 start_codon:yes stop_codon:yes gene_type:complete